MQENKEQGQNVSKPNTTTENQMAQNPNPRANENVQHTTFEKSDASDDTPDVGSEITDGEAS